MKVEITAEEIDDELVKIRSVNRLAGGLKNGIVKEAPHQQDAKNAGGVFAPGFLDGNRAGWIKKDGAADHDKGDAGTGTENAVVKIDYAPLRQGQIVPIEGSNVDADDAKEGTDAQDIEVYNPGLAGLDRYGIIWLFGDWVVWDN